MDPKHPSLTSALSQELPPGTQLEEFIIERVLGSGGFGITYLARDKRLGRQVVIKENLPAQFCWRDTTSLTVQPRHSSGEDVDNFQYSLESFEKEAATLASLDHPGIVKVLRSFEANGTAYFVMPFVEGVTFDEVMREREMQRRPFTEAELVSLLDKVLAALGYLHDRGIYHRDIKPGNLLITSQGDPVLIDFGAARQRLSERSLTVIESPGYTPFEQMQSRGKVGPWSDLYALGGTIYKAITGETPAKAADRIFEDDVVPLVERAEFRSRYSAAFLAGIDRAMRPRLMDRWQAAAEWMVKVIAPPSPSESRAVARSESLRSPLDDGAIGEVVEVKLPGQVVIPLCYCPAGSFRMGSPASEKNRSENENQVQVRISQGFWMGQTEVTQRQWVAVMGSNPSSFKGDDLPVERVSWNDAQAFIVKLKWSAPLPSGWKYALPSEAQWEYACRAGTESVFGFGDILSSWEANFDGNSPYGSAKKGPYLAKTSEVGSYQPNKWGLYDMHGNVYEWCADWYGKKLHGGVDPVGTSTGSYRVRRGGSWNFSARSCRAATRYGDTPGTRLSFLGFRVAAVPVGAR
jgi:formylglycine-generating enzyme required for sulfatase activity/predicted Ser/Thr protein kinase